MCDWWVAVAGWRINVTTEFSVEPLTCGILDPPESASYKTNPLAYQQRRNQILDNDIASRFILGTLAQWAASLLQVDRVYLVYCFLLWWNQHHLTLLGRWMNNSLSSRQGHQRHLNSNGIRQVYHHDTTRMVIDRHDATGFRVSGSITA